MGIRQARILIKTRYLVAVADRWPYNPKYPNAYQGDHKLLVRLGNRALRVRWVFAKRKNDADGVDTARWFNISPRWARWFSFFGYRCGFGENMYHVAIGHVSLSLIPIKSYSWETL